MNRPEGISPEAWSKAVDLVMDAKAERVPYYSTSEEIREARLADATAIAKAIQSSVEAEREKVAQLAVDYAAGRMRQSYAAKEAKKRAEARDFESMSMAGTDLVFAIRKGA